MKIVEILGVKLNKISKKDILKFIHQKLGGEEQIYITTPNPEFILQAHKDEEFFYILNNSSLSIPDGIGLKFAAWLIGINLIRTTGADLTKDILKIADKKKLTVSVINWRNGLSTSKDITSIIKTVYPSVNIFVHDTDRNAKHLDLKSVNEHKPDIIFCTFGAPFQEKLIYHNQNKIPSAKIAIGVGGAFDFITQKVERAPKIFRVLGFEWLWRVLSQPQDRMKRLKRIYNAVFKFTFKVIKWRFIRPFFYRANVACILYKKVSNKYKILIVERAIEKNHWQLPQGGCDGESPLIAGKRELREEVGTKNFKVKQSFKNLHKYEFGDRMSKFGVEAKKVTGYKGQSQSLIIAEYLGDDSDIKINFWDHSAWRWVDSENLLAEVHSIRKKSAKIYIDKFNMEIGDLRLES